ncbi:Biotin synthesis protein BioC [Trachymyrmex zeteki]|uniref:Biotin synthesis protein BioC n=1 Tax=Mycetomoellerius zeteki TaxID=64791 RepID=A0A151WZQ2_9HYME|nr:Biotin synthesis protein BioC [Trachymyrmex zeteki]
MIKYANETFSDKKQLQFEILDIETKNLPKKYISEFDHIFSFQTLHWCRDIRKAFENIYQMLKPNATMLVYIIASHDLFEVLKFLEQDVRFAQYIPVNYNIHVKLLKRYARNKTYNDTNKHSHNPFKYTLNNNLQREKVSAVIDEFEEYLKSISGKCLDIGCGPGDIIKDMILPALDPNAVVIGTDVSKNMIDYANKKYSVPKKLEFDVLDIQTKNLPTKYTSEFDFIFSFHALHWCNDIKQAFENIYRMLQPNGTMLILFVASHNIFKAFEKSAHDARFAQYITDINKYIWPFQKSVNPRKELKELLETVGFTVNHCSHRETFHFDENPDRFFCNFL